MATKSLIKSFQKLAISKPELTVITQHPDYTQLRINVPGNTGQRNIFRALKEATLPRKIGIHGQPRIFHSPQADTPRRRIKITPPIAGPKRQAVMEELTARQLAVLDPSGARQKMFSRHNRDAIRVGDVLRVRRKNGEQPFAGVLINIRRRGVDSAFLLRGQVTRLGVEVWFKLYSPTIEGIDLVQRREKRARRAKLYYMRKPEHDMGSVANIVGQYSRQRAMLRGESGKGSPLR